MWGELAAEERNNFLKIQKKRKAQQQRSRGGHEGDKETGVMHKLSQVHYQSQASIDGCTTMAGGN